MDNFEELWVCSVVCGSVYQCLPEMGWSHCECKLRKLTASAKVILGTW